MEFNSEESRKLFSLQQRRVQLFKTPIGNYYLPTNAPNDIVIAAMKEGLIFEPEIVAIAKQFIRKGTTVLDLGASFGQMSLLFSEFTGEDGHVYSFEADDVTFLILEKNIAANQGKNITTICKAVYDKTGEIVSYPEPDLIRFGSYGSYGIDCTGKTGCKVETITIDSLKITHPISFMKVDIQGSDLLALRGAQETIMRHRMPIVFEFEEPLQEEFGTCLQDYINFIESISYRIDSIINDINYLIMPREISQI